MIAFDTNILVYAQQESGTGTKHLQAAGLINRALNTSAIIPVQVLSEFMNVCKRKLAVAPSDAIGQVQDYLEVFESPQTTVVDVTNAALLSERSQLSYFDALIITVARRAGATILLSEDMHNGLEVNGLHVVNPFVAGNDALLGEALDGGRPLR